MVRTGQRDKLLEAMQHAKKYLSPHIESQSQEIHRAAGLLAFPKDTDTEPYKVCPIPSEKWLHHVINLLGKDDVC